LGRVTPAGKYLQSVPPLFLTKQLRKNIERLLPIGHHQRLRQYFDTYGCLHCSRRAVVYGANGFCRLCISMLGKRIRKIDKELQARKPVPPPKLEEIYLRSYNRARQLLADLRPTIAKRPIQPRPDLKTPTRVYLKF
jgi:hypothetical protein